MSTEIVNLVEFKPAGSVEPLPALTPVSRFKDGMPGRVIAPAQRFVVYTLKDASKLRVVQLAGGAQGGPSASLAFDGHTSAVVGCQFMNQKSNVVASFSEKELIVWIIPSDGSQPAPSLSYTGASVTAVAWTHPRDAGAAQTALSDLVVTTADGQLLLLPVAALHQANMQDDAGTVRATPAAVVAIKDGIKVLSKDLAKNAGGKVYRALVAEASPAVVAAVDARSVIVCRGGIATRWQPLAGVAESNPDLKDETIVDITVLSAPKPNAVVIATQRSLTFWDVSLDAPVKLLHVTVPLTVLKATATSSRLVLVLGTPDPDVKDHTLVTVAAVGLGYRPRENTLQVRGMTLRTLEMDGVPFVQSLCAITSNPASDDPYITIDNGKTLGIGSMPAFYTKPQAPGAPPAAAAAAASAGGAGALPSYSAAANPGIPAPRSQYNNAFGASAAAAASAGVATLITDNDGQFEHALGGMHQRIGQRAGAVNAKLSDLQLVLPEDHNRLLQSVLNEQREAILAAVSSAFDSVRAGGGGGASPAAASAGGFALDEESSAQISEIVIRGVSDAIVERVAQGISEALNASLAKRVDGLISTAINKYTKRVRKAQEKDGNKGAETIAAEVLDAAKKEMEAKNKDAGMQLLLQLQQLNKPATDTLQQMQRVVEQQQRFIDKFTSSGILEELQRLKGEVASLRAAAGAASGGGAAASAQNRQTILAKAKGLLEAGHAEQALAWVLPLSDAEMTLSLVSAIPAEKLGDIIEGDRECPAERWIKVATDLSQISSADKAEAALTALTEIVMSDSVNLKANARARQVLQAYCAFWKDIDLPSTPRALLRDLSAALRG